MGAAMDRTRLTNPDQAHEDAATTPFEDLFKSPEVARDNFLSRFFGLFSEHIVHDWSHNPNAAYQDLGRPTVWAGGEYSTLDFTLVGRDGRRFVAEQKAELAFEGYRYLRLTSADAIEHHTHGRAFQRFLEVAGDPTRYQIRVRGKPMPVDGAILIWGAVDEVGRAEARDTYHLADVLSLEEMIRDLRAWQDPTWLARVEQLRTWANGLLDSLR